MESAEEEDGERSLRARLSLLFFFLGSSSESGSAFFLRFFFFSFLLSRFSLRSAAAAGSSSESENARILDLPMMATRRREVGKPVPQAFCTPRGSLLG